MNSKIKYGIIAGILILSSVLLVSAIRQPNDYIAVVYNFVDFQTSPTDDNALNVTYNTAYIPLTGSATYTLTVSHMVTTINLSQPAQINNLIKTTVTNKAISNGYNLKKIIMQSYTVSNP